MKHTVRDVVLLGAAMSAFMLLVVLAPVGAEEVAAPATAEDGIAANATSEAEVRVTASVAPASAIRLAANEAPATTRPAVEARQAIEPAADTGTVERRCDPVRRIGKFTVTRCD